MKIILKYIPGVIIPTILTIVITIFYGNFLSPNDYGKLNLFTTTVSFIDIIFFSFITTSILRFYTVYKNKNEENIFLNTYFTIFCLINLFVIIVLLVFKIELFLFYVVAINGYSFFMFYNNIFRANERIAIFTFIKIIVPLMSICFILFLFINNISQTFKSMILSTFLPYLIIVIFISIFFIKENKIQLKIDKNIVLESFEFGFPLVIIGIFNLVLSAIDRYMLNYFLGSYEVGIYSFGYRIAELSMLNATNIVIIGTYPKLIAIYEKEGKKYAEYTLSKLISLHFIITIPILFILILFIEDILNIIFPNYVGSEKVVIFIAMSSIFNTLTFYTMKAFELTKTSKKNIISLIISCIVNIILNVVLIPNIGINGAIIATIFSYIIYLVLSIKVSNEFKIIFKYKNIIITIFTNILIFNIIFNIIKYIPNSYLLNVIIGTFIYILLYVISLVILIKYKFLGEW